MSHDHAVHRLSSHLRINLYLHTLPIEKLVECELQLSNFSFQSSGLESLEKNARSLLLQGKRNITVFNLQNYIRIQNVGIFLEAIIGEGYSIIFGDGLVTVKPQPVTYN